MSDEQIFSATADVPELPAAAGPEMWEWLKTTHLEPEIKQRMDAGQLEEGTVIGKAQVVFWLDRDQPEVRLNDEVGGEALVTATRDIDKGEEITTADVGAVKAYRLPEEDGDAAHVTMFSTSAGISLVFDAAYNTLLIESHLKVADQFIGLAEHALEKEWLEAFIEGAWAATELLAKSELLFLPERRVAAGKTHRTTQSLYNQWANLGNTEQRFADLLNRLGRARPSGRYLESGPKIDADEAAAAMATLRDMRGHVEEVRPKRALEETTPMRYQVTATRDIRAGEMVRPGDYRLFK